MMKCSNAMMHHSIKLLTNDCHQRCVDAGWWSDINTGESLVGKRNMGELLCLVHSEISEALEGYRKNLQDDHIPEFKAIEVELADALIRIFDIAGSENMRLGEAFVAKLEYNKTREDHKVENRRKKGGKKI